VCQILVREEKRVKGHLCLFLFVCVCVFFFFFFFFHFCFASWYLRRFMVRPSFRAADVDRLGEIVLATENMANAAHFTPTGPTISSGCSGATYAADLAHQHQKAAPVPPAHTCGLRYERSTAEDGEPRLPALVLIPILFLYRGLTTLHASAQHSSGMPRPDRPVGLQVRPLETPVTGQSPVCTGALPQALVEGTTRRPGVERSSLLIVLHSQ
jgi:hypothetical protein